MSNIYNRIDLALMSTGPTEVVDITEKGGIEHAQYVVEGENGLVDIEGCDTANGTFTTVETLSLTGTTPHRARIPLSWPRFIRLKQTGATLTIRA